MGKCALNYIKSGENDAPDVRTASKQLRKTVN